MTQSEHDCLVAIRNLFARGITPTVTEIMAEMGVSSRGGVHKWIKGLAAAGHIKTARGRARQMSLVEPLQAEINRLIAVHGRDAVEKAVLA